MRSKNRVAALCCMAIAVAANSGCSGSVGEQTQTDLATLPLPSHKVIDAAKAQPPSKSRPKFGAPPRLEILKEMRKP